MKWIKASEKIIEILKAYVNALISNRIPVAQAYLFGSTVKGTDNIDSDFDIALFLKRMQDEKVGYLAVSLGYFKTLFSSPGHSTSSEIPKEEQLKMGLSEGLVRISIGLDNNIQKTFERIKKCMVDVGLLKTT